MSKFRTLSVREHEHDVLKYFAEVAGQSMRETLCSLLEDAAVAHGFITEDQRQSVPYADLEPAAPRAKKTKMPKPRPKAITEARTPTLKKHALSEKAEKVGQRKSKRASDSALYSEARLDPARPALPSFGHGEQARAARIAHESAGLWRR